MATAWQIARSLDTLLAQLNTAHPARSRASDGGIGDAAHASRNSDHNPWFVLDGVPLVTARDYTHDPLAGLDCQRLADALRTSRDPRIKYVIWNRQIMSGAAGPSPWAWRPYSGSNPHTKHLHLSVVADARCQSVTPWSIRPTPSPAPREDPAMELDDLIPDKYGPNLRPLTVGDSIGWAAAHAATARDRATEATRMAALARDEAYTARQELAALRADVAAELTQIRELLLAQPALGPADPRAFAAAVAADLAARLAG